MSECEGVSLAPAMLAQRYLLQYDSSSWCQNRLCIPVSLTAHGDGGGTSPSLLHQSLLIHRGKISKSWLGSLLPFLMGIRAPCAAHIHMSSRSNVKRSSNLTGFPTTLSGVTRNCTIK
ncbi:hypothetical protein GOODEAATRI_018364 [Goodea atripinnis]|uniref:Uncharacterized protein n=1 Tax=Goodea atripinnis TaxID=208336 RepID=A0ABV0PZ31_9TELE